MIEAGIRKRVTHREFLKKVKRIHPQYTFTEKYNKAVQKIKVRCPKHGLFQTSPNALLSGYGCPICSESYGEREVSRILTQMRIRFIRQKKFPDLQHKRPLRFDFWLPYHKTLIEYDGVQHFQASTFFGGKKAYKATKVRDRLKTLWARRMKFPLIRIPYTHPMPEQILENKLKR
jgi:hypothetical protein